MNEASENAFTLIEDGPAPRGLRMRDSDISVAGGPVSHAVDALGRRHLLIPLAASNRRSPITAATVSASTPETWKTIGAKAAISMSRARRPISATSSRSSATICSADSKTTWPSPQLSALPC